MSLITTNPGNLFVVAVGASAGGLEAIHEFFDHIPDSSNLCFVIVQHLSSDYKSLLVELVSKHTHMQVTEAKHDETIQAGYVYVIPNDKLLSLSGNKLQLSGKEQERGPNLAIDHFLYSLATETGENAVAVILSGTGSDGTRGCAAVREAGGFVLVQDPVTAKFDGMPLSVIQAGVADLVLPPHAMFAPIYQHINYIAADDRTSFVGGSELASILDTVHQSTGYDFRQYKPATILRRISRRIANTQSASMEQYAQLLRQNHEESRLLARDFFIGVTSFFRDMEAFSVLRDVILPQLVTTKETGEGIKVWVTACSTGQEAYSMAILINEFLKENNDSREVKIFATDIDERAIEIAAKGRYPADALNAVPDVYRDAYFIQHGSEVAVVPQIRKQIVFARHNILKDPPFIKNDLVTCRNLLIYLNAKLQEGVLSTLHFSLNKGGYLLLGPSENPSVLSSELEEVNSRWKIYRKKGASGRIPYNGDRGVTRQNIRVEERKTKSQPVSPLATEFAKALADDFGYAAVYVNEQYEVKEVIGDFRRYLSLPDKLVNLNILRMVPAELSGLLSAAFRKVMQENQKMVFRNTKVNVDGTQKSFQLMVYPPGANQCILVVLGENNTSEAKPSVGDEANIPYRDHYVQELEEELRETRLNLQMAVEGLETTNEELQSTNEELQSANEELQSSNEELQSLNEELHTLNTEHQMRIRELKTLNDDLDNYFRSTEIGQIFLDRNLCIRRFNPAAVQMINLIESDIGRPISNISNNIIYADLQTEIHSVLENHQTVEREVELNNGLFCLLKIMPYLRHDGLRDGIVITFVDLTAIRNLDKIIKGVFDTTSSAILVFDAVRERGKVTDFRCTAANSAAQQLLEMEQQQPVGLLLHQHLPQLQTQKLHERFANVVESGQSLRLEINLPTPTGVQWFNVMANRLNDGLIIAFTNITPLKASEEKLRKNYNELLRTKESLKELNAQLEQKVELRTRDLSRSEERFRLVASATNDAIWDWDLSDNRVWWSDSFYKLFGYSPEDTEINTASFWIDIIHPEDRQRVKAHIYGLINSDEGQSWNNEYRLRRADGSYAVVLDRGSVMKDEWGVPYRMLGAMMDVTLATETRYQLEAKNAELEKLIKEFSFVTDFMPQIVWATRADGYHDFFNKQWYEYTGTSFDDAKDQGWAQVLHPDDFAHTREVWKRSLETGEVYETEYRLRRYDGVYRWFLARAHPMCDENSAILKWFGTCTDIHDQKLMNEVLEQRVEERTRDLQISNKELELSNNELMQFASIASHDLKEPLRKIQIFSSLVKERYFQNADPGITGHLDRIIQASSRMTRLINDLLDYSRLSANSLFKSTDLNLLLSEVLNDIELAIAEKEATVEADVFPIIDAIPGQMRQIFQNLISNSLKFSAPDRKPVINIKCSRITELSFDAPEGEDAPFCRISISDNGIGFDKQYEQKIFVIFQRLHTRENYDGTGIGLAIVKKIVERHGGIITAVGREGAGAEFIIVLPIHQLGLQAT